MPYFFGIFPYIILFDNAVPVYFFTLLCFVCLFVAPTFALIFCNFHNFFCNSINPNIIVILIYTLFFFCFARPDDFIILLLLLHDISLYLLIYYRTLPFSFSACPMPKILHKKRRACAPLMLSMFFPCFQNSRFQTCHGFFSCSTLFYLSLHSRQASSTNISFYLPTSSPKPLSGLLFLWCCL